MTGDISITEAQRFTDRDLIESIINNYFIVDYGFISAVNADKTINVTHASQLQDLTGQFFPAMTTENIEVLTISCGAFSLNFEIAKGDKVLLLGLKTLVPSVNDVTQAQQDTACIHYNRSTIKALPLCVFNSDAKVKMEIENGTLKVTANKNIELNGNTKSFVTYAELNQALQQIWTTIKTHTHPYAATTSAGTTSPSIDLASASLDISTSETKTIKTGG